VSEGKIIPAEPPESKDILTEIMDLLL